MYKRQSSDSDWLDSKDTANTWMEMSVTGKIPAGATKAQAAIEFWQCAGDKSSGQCWDGNGAVYIDDMMFYQN